MARLGFALGILLTCLEISPVSFIRRKFPSLTLVGVNYPSGPFPDSLGNPTSLAFPRPAQIHHTQSPLAKVDANFPCDFECSFGGVHKPNRN